MTNPLAKDLADLRKMGPAELRAKYQAVFGDPIRTGNGPYMVKRIAWRLQMLAEGDLTQRARKRAAELANDADVRATVPKAPAPARRIDQPTVTGRIKKAGITPLPMPGAVLTREYKGRTHQVTVLPNGFDYEGAVYGSLSAVAKAITGSHWNGHLFFGLRGGK